MIEFDLGPDGGKQSQQLEQAFQTAVGFQQKGRPALACIVYSAIHRKHPRLVEALRLWGVAELQQGRTTAAVERLRQALALEPENAAVHCNLGSALRIGGELNKARESFTTALAQDPGLAEAHNNLGSLALLDGDFETAGRHYREAVEINPESAIAHANLAATLLRQGRGKEALAAARRARSIDPQLKPALRLEAFAIAAVGSPQDAVSALQACIAAHGEDAELLHHLGVAQEELGEWDRALDSQQRALELEPAYGAALSDALFLRRRLCQWQGIDALAERFDRLIDQERTGLKPFTLLSEWSDPQRQLRCARLWSRQFPRAGGTDHRPSGDPLVVGYLSNGFRRHPTAVLTAPLFESHNREGFRWIGYSTGPDDGSALRARVADGLDVFRDLHGWDHGAIADRIEQDEVDILVDLRGYGGGAVTPVLARRPAPIQVNWLAYPGTMGAEFMDYIVVDRHVVTPEILAGLDEAPVILPHSYQPCDVSREPEPSPLSRTECGLPHEGVVYCSFNNSYKFSARVFDRWMAILDAVPGSVLWLLEGRRDTSLKSNLATEARARGVDPERIVWMAKLPHREYLARYRLADLFLDTLPYNAHTTAGDALFAGCPVLTCTGNTFAGRVAGSLLHSAGLPELVTTSLDDYQALAVELGRDPERLQALRVKLQQDRENLPLFQPRRLAGELEHAYRWMAERCRDGLPPTRLEVPSAAAD